jgi:SAM-dependent methyltransferase
MTEPDYAALKEGTKALWSLGDYSQIEKFTRTASEALVEACAVSAGQEVLDVAAGTGNFALLAAAEGASVVASDLTPHLIERGKQRTAEEGCDIEWVEADAEELPFEDERFDCTASVFGAMFAPRPDVVAQELFRVTRPGNTVGMASWSPDGFNGRIFDMMNKLLPRPDGIAAPIEWGREEVVRERFDGLAGSIETERRHAPLEFESVEALMSFFDNAGPQAAAKQAMGPELYDQSRREFREITAEFNQADDGSVSIQSEYLLVVARRRG